MAQESGVVRTACRKQGTWTRAGSVQRQMGSSIVEAPLGVLLWLFWLTECQVSSLVALWGDGQEGQQKEFGGGCCSGSKAQMAVVCGGFCTQGTT